MAFHAPIEHDIGFAQYVTVPPGVGKTHLAIALGRAVVEAGHTVLFTTATALLADLVDGQSKGILASRMFFYGKPKLLVVDELGYTCRSNARVPISSFSSCAIATRKR